MLETAPALLVLSGGRPLSVLTRTDVLSYFTAVADAALDLVEPAIEDDRFEEAQRLAAVGLAAATRGRDIELRKRARRVRDQARQRLAEVKKHER